MDYSVVNYVLYDFCIRMYQLADFNPAFNPSDYLSNANLKDGYYRLRLRSQDQFKLVFMVGDDLFFHLSLNCGLKASPVFFTKFIKPVVFDLLSFGQTFYAYLDSFFLVSHPTTHAYATPLDTTRLVNSLYSIPQTEAAVPPGEKHISRVQPCRLL